MSRPERAVKHSYEAFSGQWSSERVKVLIDGVPFDEGAMRTAVSIDVVRLLCFLSLLLTHSHYLSIDRSMLKSNSFSWCQSYFH